MIRLKIERSWLQGLIKRQSIVSFVIDLMLNKFIAHFSPLYFAAGLSIGGSPDLELAETLIEVSSTSFPEVP